MWRISCAQYRTSLSLSQIACVGGGYLDAPRHTWWRAACELNVASLCVLDPTLRDKHFSQVINCHLRNPEVASEDRILLSRFLISNIMSFRAQELPKIIWVQVVTKFVLEAVASPLTPILRDRCAFVMQFLNFCIDWCACVMEFLNFCWHVK